MESIIFVVLMMAGHLLMMFLMPGMHGGHNKAGHVHTDEAEAREKLEMENIQLKAELNAVKSRANQDE